MITMVTQGMLWLLALALAACTVVSATVQERSGGDPVEAISWYLRPDNPLTRPLLTALNRFADQNMRTIFSASDSVDSDVDKALQYFASLRAESEMYGCCGSTVATQDRFDNVQYVDGSWRERFALLSKAIDLLHFSLHKKLQERDIVGLSSDFSDVCRRVSAKTGLLFVDGCKGNEMACRVLEHFAEKNGFATIEQSEAAFSMQRTGYQITDPVSVSNTNQPSSMENAINQLLAQGHLRALFMNHMSPGEQRHAGWLKVAQMAKLRNLKYFLQTGTMRPQSDDGKSTVVLARLAKMVSGQLTVVDSDSFEYAQAMTAAFRDNVRFVREVPVSYLSRLSQQVDLLYLNSLQFDHIDEGPVQQYRWAEINFAQRLFGQGAIVVLDNCDLLFEGPCKLATRYLVNDLNMMMVEEGPLRIFSASLDESGLVHVRPPQQIAPRPPTSPSQQQQQPQPEQQQQPPVPNFESNESIEAIFKGLMDRHGHRYVSFRMVAELAVKRGARVLLETGTARNGIGNCGGDGCSTAILGRLARLIGGRLHTVDISAQNIEGARRGTTDLANYIDYHVSDSVAFIANFAKPIDILYLDSYDYDGIEYGPSQQHHLKELKAAWSKIHDNTVIFLDDCSLAYEGKCKMASQFLREKGWSRIVDAYQRVYVKQ